jgi:hypothetical protein
MQTCPGCGQPHYGTPAYCRRCVALMITSSSSTAVPLLEPYPSRSQARTTALDTLKRAEEERSQAAEREAARTACPNCIEKDKRIAELVIERDDAHVRISELVALQWVQAAREGKKGGA